MPDIDQIEVSANVKVLEYITQVTLIMDDDSLTFTTSQNARPFNGIFEAEISASVQIDSAVFQNISDVPAVLNVTF